jgi:hypothetical protein
MGICTNSCNCSSQEAYTPSITTEDHTISKNLLSPEKAPTQAQQKTSQQDPQQPDKESKQQRALEQQEKQLFKSLELLFKAKAWEAEKGRFDAVRGNLEEINSKIKQFTEILAHFKLMSEEKDKLCPCIFCIKRYLHTYVNVLNDLQGMKVNRNLVVFFNQLDVEKLSPLNDEEIGKKFEQLQVSSELCKLLDTKHMEKFEEFTKIILAIYQNLQQQAILHQTTP